MHHAGIVKLTGGFLNRAISQADLVIVPMQPTALDAEIGSEALALVK
jgi:chromosome partitioning protein